VIDHPSPDNLPSAARVNGDRLWSRLMDMAEIGATQAGGSNRQALSDDDQAGRELFLEWATSAGCHATTDKVGNLFVTRPGRSNDDPPVVLGSHLDTQPTGGRFDGVYGVLGALEVVESLNDRNIETPVPLQIAVWTNEEGSRFPVSMMGSAVWAGSLDLAEVLCLRDTEGISVGTELDRLGWVGEAPFGHPMAAYIELHIEQGPILEASSDPIGVVTGVQGLRWYTISFAGSPAHAGPTPMDVRQDPARALASALQSIYGVAADHGPWARATPAQFRSFPVSPNTVPAEISFSLDLRHPDSQTLDSMDRAVTAVVSEAARTHQCGSAITVDNYSAPVDFDAGLVSMIEAAANGCGFPNQRIVSGAGHDACYVATKAPTAMIFVPCENGLSHNEAESISALDAQRGADVLLGTALKVFDELA